MPLSKQDNDYRFELIKRVDPKTVDIDRAFTNLLPLLKYEGATITRGRSKFVTIDDLRIAICELDSRKFEGFEEHPNVVSRWLESDFLSLVHRGKDIQQIAAPLPMHLNTYKLRNIKHCRDYGVADQVFALLYHGAPDVMKALGDFLFRGADYYSDKYDEKTDLDIETLLMMRILDQKERDYADNKKPADIPVPLYIGQAYLLGDDIARLLAYQEDVPRLVLIDYIKNVMALHIGIYILRLFQVLPHLVEHGELHPNCHSPVVLREDMGLFIDDSSFPVRIQVDMGENYKTHMAELSRQQFNSHLQELNRYVRAHLKLKKLEEFALNLEHKGQIRRPQTLNEYLALQDYEDQLELKTFFEIRIRGLMNTDDGEPPDERLIAIRRLGLSEIDTYVEMLYLLRQRFHQKYYTELLDSLFLKNRDNGLMRAGYGSINKRRYSLGSSLLETLVQIAVLESSPGGSFRTHSIRVDDFIDWLRRRYGIYISRLPDGREPTIADLEALRFNVDSFRKRLREIGFYTDLSDAYIAQVIRPRYHIG